MRRAFILLGGLPLFWFLVASRDGGADEQIRNAGRPAQAGGARRIQLQHCRIKFIDEVQLASQRSGILQSVAGEGMRVEQGEIAVQLKDDVVRATLAIAAEQATNDVEVRFARKASELAQLQYTRSVRANQLVNETVSDFMLRQNRLAAEKSLLQLEKAETALRVETLRRTETEELLKTYRVEAPFDGVVRKVFKKRGEAVREGEPIVEIANNGRVQVEGYIGIDDAQRVKPGALVEVRLDLPNLDLEMEKRRFSGRIAFVDVKVEPVSNRVRVWAEVQNGENVLKDGLTAVMTIDPQNVDPGFAASRVSAAGQRPRRSKRRPRIVPAAN